MKPWEIEARESIRDLVARYNANGDTGRIDEMLTLFAEDARLEVPGETLRGRETIRAFMERIASGSGRKPIHLLRHFIATHQIDLESPDAARGRCYYQVLTEDGLDHWGLYVDEYVKHEDRWLFAARRASVDGAVSGSWAREES